MSSTDRLRQLTLTSSRLHKLIAASHVPNQQASQAFNTYRDLLRSTGAVLHGQRESSLELAMKMRFMRVTCEIEPEDWLELTMSDIHDLEVLDDGFEIARIVYSLSDFYALFSEWYQLLFKPATVLQLGGIEDSDLASFTTSGTHVNAWVTPWEVEATHDNLEQGFPVGVRIGSIVNSDDYNVEHSEDEHPRPLSLSNQDYLTGAVQLTILPPQQTPRAVTMKLTFTALDLNTFDRPYELQATRVSGQTFEFTATNARFEALAMELHRLYRFVVEDRWTRSLLAQRFPLIAEPAILHHTIPENFPATVWLGDQHHNQLRIKSARILVSSEGTDFYQSFPILELVPDKRSTRDRSFSCVLSVPHLVILISVLRHYIYLWHNALSDHSDADDLR